MHRAPPAARQDQRQCNEPLRGTQVYIVVVTRKRAPMLLGVAQQCLFGLMLLAPGVYTQPEAPYPDTAGWLPLAYEHTADGYDNHDEHYANKGECLPGSTVQLRGHVQCVSGNQEWCVRWINPARFSDSAPFRRVHLTAHSH